MLSLYLILPSLRNSDWGLNQMKEYYTLLALARRPAQTKIKYHNDVMPAVTKMIEIQMHDGVSKSDEFLSHIDSEDQLPKLYYGVC